jgi:hypothetical protein
MNLKKIKFELENIISETKWEALVQLATAIMVSPLNCSLMILK